jgi:hypothetical protein
MCSDDSGKITDIKVTPGANDTKDATVVFEKETAARTAQLLNNTQLGGVQIGVVAGDDKGLDSVAPARGDEKTDSEEITQEQKPRSRILAEYLAHGYMIGDAALQRSIELDQQHGVTSRFFSTLQGFDQKYHATDRARATDQSYGISQRANNVWNTLGSYFEKATSSPTGQKIVKFYEDGSRQVQDIHTEARRLAELRKEEHGGSAYKAAGLERVFGKEKDAEKKDTTGASTSTGTASDIPQPGPKAGTTDPTPISTTGHDLPSKVPGTEKQ